MILVAGGSGRLGSLLVQRLVAGGATVGAQAHPRTSRASRRRAGRDRRGRRTRRLGCSAGCRRRKCGRERRPRFCGSRSVSPASVDRDGNRHLVDAAAQAGATVIPMSVVGASAESPMELFRMKDAAEQYLRASGTQWTIVRSTAFLETWIDLIADTADRAGRVVVFGRGQNPINFISVHDVAALVDRVIGDQEARGHTIEIGGPLLAGTRTSRSGRPRARHDGSALQSPGYPRAISGHFAHLSL